MNFTKIGLTLSVTAGTLFTLTPEALAGSMYKSSYSSSCSRTCNLNLPASHNNIKLVTPGTSGTIRKTSTTSTRTVTIEDTYDFDIIVKPTGVTSRVINVESSGVSLPCTECTLEN